MTDNKPLRDLRKSNRDKQLAGICGGFGEYTPLPSWMWRAIFAFALFLGGAGLLAYIILWLTMPDAEESSQS